RAQLAREGRRGLRLAAESAVLLDPRYRLRALLGPGGRPRRQQLLVARTAGDRVGRSLRGLLHLHDPRRPGPRRARGPDHSADRALGNVYHRPADAEDDRGDGDRRPQDGQPLLPRRHPPLPTLGVRVDRRGVLPPALPARPLYSVRPRRLPLEADGPLRSEEHTSELQSRFDLVCRLLLEKKKERRTIRQGRPRTKTEKGRTENRGDCWQKS